MAIQPGTPIDQPVCAGCIGRGTGRVCCVCGEAIPEPLRRQPGDPSEITGRVTLTRDMLLTDLRTLNARLEAALEDPGQDRQYTLERTQMAVANLLETADDGVIADVAWTSTQVSAHPSMGKTSAAQVFTHPPTLTGSEVIR